MPTGYTADLTTDTPFKTFALICARNFLPQLRDEPHGPAPETLPPFTDYYGQRLRETQQALGQLLAYTPQELATVADDAWQADEDRRQERLQEIAAKRTAYTNMREQVIAWIPPTEKHKGLKSFMLEQLDESIWFDCSTRYYETPASKLSPEEWKARHVLELNGDIRYYTREAEQQAQRHADFNAWLTALHVSL